MRAKSVTDVILGEAVSGSIEKRYEDMKAIASVMVNRARSLGVPLETVVQNQREFNAYNKRLPAGVNAYRGLAEQALSEVVTNGPVHNATFYATRAAKHNLPKGLVEETRTGGHVYFSDPKNRAIGTAVGYRRPDPVAAAQYAGINENNIPVPSVAPRGVMEALGSTRQEIADFQDRGLRNAAFPATPMPVERGLLADVQPSFDAGRFGPTTANPMLADVRQPPFDAGRFGPKTANPMVTDIRQPAFDSGRFGPRTESVATFDEGRFGRGNAMNFQNMVDANRATRPQPTAVAQFDSGRFGTMTTQPQGMNELRQGLLAANAQFAPQGILNTAAAAQPALQAAAKTARLPASGPRSFQGPVAPGMQGAMDAANLALDVADQRARLGLPQINQPSIQTGYVDPMVTTSAPAVSSPAVAAPARAATSGGLLSVDGPPTGGFGPSMTVADADRMKRNLQMRTLGAGVLGGLLGGVALGPAGALIGGYGGRQVGARTYYPEAPKKAPTSDNKGYRENDLSSEGRQAQKDSKQFDRAVKSGKGGLW